MRHRRDADATCTDEDRRNHGHGHCTEEDSNGMRTCSVKAGETATISCIKGGTDQEIVWYKVTREGHTNWTSIPGDVRNRSRIEMTGTRHNKIKVTGQLGRGMILRCGRDNENEQESKYIKIRVRPKGKIIECYDDGLCDEDGCHCDCRLDKRTRHISRCYKGEKCDVSY